ncbi:MAG TPA: hypothetical protein VF710_07070 [Longimicrobium sp.]|jgi:hypothetical protein
MSVVRCRECGGDVSTQAAVCPHCGISNPALTGDARDHGRGVHDHAPVRRRGGKGGWMMALLLLMILLALFGLWYGNIVDFN